MPTFDRTDSFKSDYKQLSDGEQALVKAALEGFIEDLTAIDEGKQQHFRQTLRVKPMRGQPGIWEMTWEYQDGRATFAYGDEVQEGKSHIVWRRIGTHGIFSDP